MAVGLFCSLMHLNGRLTFHSSLCPTVLFQGLSLKHGTGSFHARALSLGREAISSPLIAVLGSHVKKKDQKLLLENFAPDAHQKSGKIGQEEVGFVYNVK